MNSSYTCIIYTVYVKYIEKPIKLDFQFDIINYSQIDPFCS